jgi:large subunit ribosomal protein L22
MPTDTAARPLEVKAVLRHGRFSSYKAREVLNLIRGKSIAEARSILQFTERGCAVPIMKVLESAVANAGNNNDIPPEELFITACFADEGPTLRRFRPRARGRGTRIRKRTCHVTIVLARYGATELERRRLRDAGRRVAPADARASRARRVARSRGGETTDAAAESTDVETDELVADDLVDETTETVADDVVDTDTDDGVEETDAEEAEVVEPAAESEDDTSADAPDESDAAASDEKDA